MNTRLASVVAAMLLIATGLSRAPAAFTLQGGSWTQWPVPYSINTTNLDLPESAIEPAVRAGADVWAQQGGTTFSFSYAGRSAQTTTTYDGLNLVVFRNASSGSAIATTYSWTIGSQLVDADIVFWDGAFTFFTGSNGCSGGFYIEDIAAHEFGHALGLNHSTSPSATMYPSVGYCDPSNRTLDADDIAGIHALYPPALPPPPPTGVHIVS